MAHDRDKQTDRRTNRTTDRQADDNTPCVGLTIGRIYVRAAMQPNNNKLHYLG